MLASLLANPTVFFGELPRPDGAFEEWATWAGKLLGVIERLPDPGTVAWQEWAGELVSLLAAQGLSLPEPARFAEWLEWAGAARETYPGG